MEMVGVGAVRRGSVLAGGDFGVSVANGFDGFGQVGLGEGIVAANKFPLAIGLDKINGAGNNLVGEARAMVGQNFIKKKLAEIVAVGG